MKIFTSYRIILKKKKNTNPQREITKILPQLSITHTLKNDFVPNLNNLVASLNDDLVPLYPA